jgi:phage terminase small subunit
MAVKGQKPKSAKQKKAQGETRPCRLVADVVEFPTVEKIPEAPKWLNEDGVELWNKMAPMLFNQKVLTHADLDALSHLCMLHGQIVKDYRRELQPTGANLQQLRMYFAEFGMTPSSRTRIGQTGNGKEKNTFKKNGAKARAN